MPLSDLLLAQITAAEGTCRLMFRARGWTQQVAQLLWSMSIHLPLGTRTTSSLMASLLYHHAAKRPQPAEPSACEARLHPLLPNALLALTLAEHTEEYAIYIPDLLRSTPKATQAKIQRLLRPTPADPCPPWARSGQMPVVAGGEDDQVW
jgi:hypothetical protein